jgi:hypothetical protein
LGKLGIALIAEVGDNRFVPVRGKMAGPQSHLPCRRCRIACLAMLLIVVILTSGLIAGVIRKLVRRAY